DLARTLRLCSCPLAGSDASRSSSWSSRASCPSIATGSWSSSRSGTVFDIEMLILSTPFVFPALCPIGARDAPRSANRFGGRPSLGRFQNQILEVALLPLDRVGAMPRAFPGHAHPIGESRAVAVALPPLGVPQP